jgi:hypothetical protein
MARYIKIKGINAVHPRKELEGEYLTSNQVGNLTRPRAHGLIAKIDGEPGNYCLTWKGLSFLKGQGPIPKYAIMSKKSKTQIGYLSDVTVHVNEYNTNDTRWEGVGYDIVEGRVINKITNV